MIENHIDIPTADGAMNTFVVHPDEGGPYPVVLFYMDAPGKREELHDMARRIAAVGYYVVLPNLYYRRTREYELKERTEANMAEMFEHMNSLGYKTIVSDTEAMLKLRRCAARGRLQAYRRRGLLHERAVRGGGRGGVSRSDQVHRVHPRREHGDRQARLAAPHGAASPVRELLRLRRDRQVGFARRHGAAAGRAAGRRHAAPHRVVSRRRTRLRFPAARGIYDQAVGGAALGAAV